MRGLFCMTKKFYVAPSLVDRKICTFINSWLFPQISVSWYSTGVDFEVCPWRPFSVAGGYPFFVSLYVYPLLFPSCLPAAGFGSNFVARWYYEEICFNVLFAFRNGSYVPKANHCLRLTCTYTHIHTRTEARLSVWTNRQSLSDRRRLFPRRRRLRRRRLRIHGRRRRL